MIEMTTAMHKIKVVFVLILCLLSFNRSSANDPIQLHIDKTIYSPGESMRIKGYIIDNSLLSNGRDFNLSLIDLNNGSTLTSLRLKPSQLIDGISISLNNSLQSAVYQLRVFDESYQLVYNSTSFLIFNPADERAVFDEKSLEDLEFFVEGGGDLVSGIENTVVVQYKNIDNLSSQNLVIIKDRNDSIISKFNLKESGLGRTKLIPNASDSYILSIMKDGNELITKAMPPSKNAGVTINMAQTANSDIWVNIEFVKTPLDGHKLTVLNKLNVIEEFEITEQNFKQQFRSSTLPEGVIQFVVFNNAGQVVKSRLIFNRKAEKLQLIATPEKTIYNPGEMVKLTLKGTNQNGSPVPANVSISVADANQVKDLVTYKQNKWTYSLADLDQTIDNPQNYFEPSLSEEWRLDDLMITVNKNVSGEKKYDQITIPEGINVYGRVANPENKTHPQGVVLTIPGLNSIIRYAPTNDTGDFLFTGFDFEGIQQVYLSAWPPGSEDVFEWFVNLPQPNLEDINAPTISLDNKLAEIIKYNSIRLRVEEQYFAKSDEELVQKEREESFGGMLNVDKTIQMDDYISLPNMKTVIKEVVPYTQIKKTGFKVFSPELRRTFPGKPLILLDGIPVEDSVILKQDPIIFNKIELLYTFKNIYKIGKVAENGVVAFYTRSGHRVDNINTFQLEVRGYYKDMPPKGTQSPNEIETPYMPAVLYWNSSLDLESDEPSYIEFRAPDYETTLSIHIEGLSPDNGYGVRETTIKISR